MYVFAIAISIYTTQTRAKPGPLSDAIYDAVRTLRPTCAYSIPYQDFMYMAAEG